MNKLIMIFLLLSNYCLAGEISGDGSITELYVNGAGTFARVRFSQPIVNPDACEKVEFYIIELDDTPGSSRYLATLITAYTLQKTVAFWIHGCTTKSYWGGTRPKLFDIYMK